MFGIKTSITSGKQPFSLTIDTHDPKLHIIAWRNLHRNKFISFITIGGLAIGMPNFNDRLSGQDIIDVKNYILSRAKIKRENK